MPGTPEANLRHTMTPQANLNIPSLTSFRFITAFMVFLFHCQIHLDWEIGIRIFDRFIHHGAVFMTGFFVLSGYIMTHVYTNTDFRKPGNMRSFYLKRFAKIYPTYALATIAYFAFFRDFTLPQHLRILFNDLFLVQGFFPSMFPLGINAGTWSLTVEMFLYLLFPLVMLTGVKSPRLVLAGVLIALIASVNVNFDRTDPVYANPIFRVGDFLCGIGFYFGCQHLKHRRRWHCLTILLLFIACVYLGAGKYQYMRGHLVFVPLFGLWIALVHRTRSAIYNNRPFVYLGLISYSFYLWQFAAIEFGKKMTAWFPDTSLHLIVLIVFAVNVAISAVSYHLVEERLRKWILARFGHTARAREAHTPALETTGPPA
jgi:peptidoglycan/LPS O-acetylase OafA/YrhL